MAGIVVVGLVLGVLIATWWSITPVSRAPSPRVAANAGSTRSPDGWTDRGWAVVDDEPWRAAVVRITTDRCGVEIRGSGVIVDGIVLTNRHVIDGAASVLLTTADGTTHPVRSIGVSSEVDLARLAAGGLPAVCRSRRSRQPSATGMCWPGSRVVTSSRAVPPPSPRSTGGGGSPTRIVVSASTVRSFPANREAP
ncbi:MAG: trypsin-like peptidase domain-containing protein [Microthrixaceae bacterium]